MVLWVLIYSILHNVNYRTNVVLLYFKGFATLLIGYYLKY